MWVKCGQPGSAAAIVVVVQTQRRRRPRRLLWREITARLLASGSFGGSCQRHRHSTPQCNAIMREFRPNSAVFALVKSSGWAHPTQSECVGWVCKHFTRTRNADCIVKCMRPTRVAVDIVCSRTRACLLIIKVGRTRVNVNGASDAAWRSKVKLTAIGTVAVEPGQRVLLKVKFRDGQVLPVNETFMPIVIEMFWLLFNRKLVLRSLKTLYYGQ